jgi:transcription elongation GreA/GreB family factor
MPTSKIAKELLVEKCREYVSDRIAHAKEAMQEAQEAANEESKSSAGDKYNTVRALMQIETDKHARQLIEAQKLSATLDLIHFEKKYEQAELGSLVHTNSGIYFIAISLGKLTVDGKELFVISAVSPIGNRLLGKVKGDIIEFNGKKISVDKIE